MEELFSNNLFAIYVIACVAVISYTNFRESQRMFILYLFTYGTAYLGIFSISESAILLLISTFVFLEYLTEDTKKAEIIVRLSYKFCDYAFMMFFQYHFSFYILSFVFIFFSHLMPSEILKLVAEIISILFLIICEQKTITQPFKIKTITQINSIFEQYPIYDFKCCSAMDEKFALLCAFEDKTYFQRTNSYSCVSYEYVKYFLKGHGLSIPEAMLKALCIVFKPSIARKAFAAVKKRGYSTPEMQLIRTIGVARGYDKHKFQRKVFEVLYSKIFFTSLKEYHEANTCLQITHYRHYLLYIYFNTVLTKINDRRYIPLASVFKNSQDISSWSMNGLFIACLGLSFRKPTENTLRLYDDVIKRFSLNRSHIYQLASQFPGKKFPSEESNAE